MGVLIIIRTEVLRVYGYYVRTLTQLLYSYIYFCLSIIIGQYYCTSFFCHHFCLPAQLGGGFTLSDLLDKPWYVPSTFITHRVQHSHCSSIFIECCKKKSPRVCALGENWTRKIDFSTSRHEDNLPSHRGCRPGIYYWRSIYVLPNRVWTTYICFNVRFSWYVYFQYKNTHQD